MEKPPRDIHEPRGEAERVPVTAHVLHVLDGLQKLRPTICPRNPFLEFIEGGNTFFRYIARLVRNLLEHFFFRYIARLIRTLLEMCRNTSDTRQ